MQNTPKPILHKRAPIQPYVAIVGRTNVGKSTLFNRLARRPISIVQPEHGTTIDRISTDITWKRFKFQLVDTGGFSFAKEVMLRDQINTAVESALQESSLILFVCDGQAGLHPQDELFAEKLFAKKKRVVLVVNKLDSIDWFSEADRFYRLGFEHLVKVSAAHGLGTEGLLDLITEKLPECENLPEFPYEFSLTIAGEPNSGKSTYFNALLDAERAIVSEIPGTTRDVVTEDLIYNNKHFLLRDTAGLRAKKTIETPIQQFSMHRTQDAIRSSEVVLLLVDGYKGFSNTSKLIARFILDSRKPAVIVINKWDQIRGFEQAKYEALLKQRAPFLSAYPVTFISAKTKRNLAKPLDAALNVYANHTAHLKTHLLNEFLQKLKTAHSLREKGKLKYLTQARTSPPHFILMGRNLKHLPPSAVQFIKAKLQDEFQLSGTPIELTLREEMA